MEQNNTSIWKVLDQLPTETLVEMLRQEAQDESGDGDALRLILKILREREAKEAETRPPIVLTPQQEAAWETYKQRMRELAEEQERTRKTRHWIIRAASLAAILVLVFLPILPQGAHAESLWSRFTRWTVDIVDFFGPKDNEDRLEEYVFQTENPGLQQLYDAVVEMGVTKPVVPMWLPEIEDNVTIKATQLPACSGITVEYPNNEMVYKIDCYHTEVSRKYAKDETEIKKFAVNETTFYIMRNLDCWVAIWNIDEIECFIQIDCQEDVLYKVLKSIYSMEDM